MTIYELEPWALGFIESNRPDREYRIASGFYSYAKNIPLTIDPSEVFVSPSAMGTQFVSYERGSGIEVNNRLYEKKKQLYPEFAVQLQKIEEYMRALETPRVISKVRSVRDEKLEINKCCWAAGGGHSNPDYELLLREGTNGIRAKINRFRKIHKDKAGLYDAFELTLDGFELVAARYKSLAEDMIKTAEGKDKETLGRLIDAFSNIPQNRPRNFFEACEFFWLAFAFVDIDSPGLFDYALGRYYQNDDKDDRYECLTALWELFRKTRTWNLCVGGSFEDGRDFTCDLTYDVLRLAKEKKYNTPNLTMRTHKGTPEALWQAAIDTLSTGIGMPAIYNDEVVCPALEALGIPASDSHLYCMNGCNQIDIFGKSHMGLEDGEISIIKAVEFALYDGVCKYTDEFLGVHTGDPREFNSFGEFMGAFYAQLDFMCDYVTGTSYKAQEIFAKEAPNPWKSLIVSGCIEKGLDYKDRGPYYGHGQVLTEGMPDAADCLTAIRHFIYDEKKYTMAELIAALDADFEGYDELYRDFSGYKKFGNDDDEPDAVYAVITDHFYRYLQTKQTYRGGVFGAGCSTFHRAPNYGLHCGALPNGKRRFDTILADSIGATPGNDKNGPTALMNSVLKCNQYLATSGNVLQMKFSKATFTSPDGRNAFENLIKTYFRLGGQTLQINVVSKQEMIDAQEHPELHENLIVRVGGFSEYFNRLAYELQRNIISRTEQDI